MNRQQQFEEFKRRRAENPPPPPKPLCRELPCIWEGTIREFCTCTGERGSLRHIRNCDNPKPGAENTDRCTRGEGVNGRPGIQSCLTCSYYEASTQTQ